MRIVFSFEEEITGSGKIFLKINSNYEKNIKVGNSYANIIVKGQTQEQVVMNLEQLQRNAYVSPFENNYTIVYDECSEYDSNELFKLTSIISKNLNCYALAILNHDEDVFIYELYNSGTMIDEFTSKYENSDISFKQLQGNNKNSARALCEAFDVIKNLKKVEKLLGEASRGIETLSSTYHSRLIKLLNIPFFWAGDSVGGYRYITRGSITPLKRQDVTKIKKIHSLLKKTKTVNTENIFSIEAQAQQKLFHYLKNGGNLDSIIKNQ